MKITFHKLQPTSTPEQGSASIPEQDKIKLPSTISLLSHIPPFLTLPLEIRLQIYNLCFFQDVQKYSTRTRNILSRDCWKGDYPDKFHEFGLLLVNHRIHNEAAAIAYRAQRHHLIQSHQTYYLSPTQLSTKRSKKCSWELESQWVWQPSCRSAKALAALRLPKLGLAFRDPYRAGVYSTTYPKKNLITEDQVDALKAFFRSLVYHLRQENVTESIEIYLEGHNSGFLRCIFGASRDLQVSRCFARSRETQYEVVYLSDDVPFVSFGETILGLRAGKAKMWHWMKAPEAVGRRFPEDMASCYSLRALKDFLENRGGKWEDWHLGMLAQQ